MRVNWVLQGDALQELQKLPDECVQCCVTSPPYWGLRDYGTAKWEGGDPDCDHKLSPYLSSPKSTLGGTKWGKSDGSHDAAMRYANTAGGVPYRDVCKKCGAQRIDAQLGLEATPEEYVQKLVEIFREVKRVLRKDGTLWLNLGDSYVGGGRAGKNPEYQERHTMFGKPAKHKETFGVPMAIPQNLKAKDLVGIPWRVAFALQADGWYLRCDIIWHKPNPMPESVRDRPTKAHEYIFLLSKNKKYFYDQEAIRERMATTERIEREAKKGMQKKFIKPKLDESRGDSDSSKSGKCMSAQVGSRDYLIERGGRNKRSVWRINTKPYKEAHFAVFPPQLPALCIQAGTSAKGCCAECGAPYERVVTRKIDNTGYPNGPGGRHKVDESRNDSRGTSSNLHKVARYKTKTKGWSPSCDHPQNKFSKVRKTPQGTHKAIGGQHQKWLEKHPTQTVGWEGCECEGKVKPCVVLDPFGGAGTTAMVAKVLGRDCITIELNPEYCELIHKRLEKPDWKLDLKTQVKQNKQRTLF